MRPGPYTCKSCGHDYVIPPHYHPCSRMRALGTKTPKFPCPECGAMPVYEPRPENLRPVTDMFPNGLVVDRATKFEVIQESIEPYMMPDAGIFGLGTGPELDYDRRRMVQALGIDEDMLTGLSEYSSATLALEAFDAEKFIKHLEVAYGIPEGWLTPRPPAATDLFLQMLEEKLKLARQLTLDRLIYGNSYEHVTLDGTRTRVDPRHVHIHVEPATEGEE